LHQSRMFPTLVILNAPKSGTPDFGVKPGNDGGNRGTSVPHPFDRDLLLAEHRAAPRAEVRALQPQAADNAVDIRDELPAQTKDIGRTRRALCVLIVRDLNGNRPAR
jgi:hypothetical protein